jgi:hypothetical protein
MNNRASIAICQRAGRKRRQGKRGNQGSSSEVEDIIEVDESGDSTRRQRIEIESPSLGARTRRQRQG